MADLSEIDKWLIGLAPEIKAIFDGTHDALEAERAAIPSSKDAVDSAETELLQRAKQSGKANGVAAHATSQSKPDQSSKPEAGKVEASKVHVGGSCDINGKLEKAIPFKYGTIKIPAQAKLAVSNENGSSAEAGGGASTELGPKGPNTTVSVGSSVGIGDFDLFNGIDVEEVILTPERASE